VSAFAAMLRAVNVGGTGKLPMSRLRSLCEEVGFLHVTTYIQSGNVVFTSALAEPKVKAKLEKTLAVEMGKPCAALLRSAAELAKVVAENPFKSAAPNQVLVVFLDEAPAKDALAAVKVPGREVLRLSGRELFIHFPEGMGKSKLRVPFAAIGTGRNMNTVVKLAEMAKALGGSA
jgi:uncharacterized protein (DUF1697 family)